MIEIEMKMIKEKEEERLLAFMGEKIKEEMEKLRKEISVQKNGNGYDAHWERNFWPSNQYQNHQPGYVQLSQH